MTNDGYEEHRAKQDRLRAEIPEDMALDDSDKWLDQWVATTVARDNDAMGNP